MRAAGYCTLHWPCPRQHSGRCCGLPPGGGELWAARDAYLARFAEAEDLFSFSDFSLYVITPSFGALCGGVWPRYVD